MRLCALIAVVVLAGCGGGGGPTKAAYIAKADPICRSTHQQSAALVAQIAALASGSLSARQAGGAAATVGKLHKLGTDYFSELRGLEKPSGDAKDLDAFLTSTGKVVDAVGDAQKALASGQVLQALSVLQQATPIDAQAKRAAQAYGFKQCGSVVSSAG